MKVKRKWPWILALFGLVASIGLSARSWHTVDLVNLPLRKEGPFLTIFTKGSSFQINFSETQHCYYFGANKPREAGDDHSRPSAVRSWAPGIHQVGIGERSRDSQVIIGQFSAKRTKGSRNGIYLILPIWFVLFGGSFAPLAIWYFKKNPRPKSS